MLVYLKEPMGYSVIDGRRVYGRFYAHGAFGPVNLPRSVYLEHKDILEEIEISKEWLKKKTGKEFPASFKTSELFLLDFDVTVEIAALLGIDYIKSKTVTRKQKAALHRAIISKIDML